MEVWAFPSQQSDRPCRDRDDDALYHAGYGLHERGTHQGWIRSGSSFVKAKKNSLVATIAIAGFGTILWLLASGT